MHEEQTYLTCFTCKANLSLWGWHLPHYSPRSVRGDLSSILSDETDISYENYHFNLFSLYYILFLSYKYSTYTIQDSYSSIQAVTPLPTTRPIEENCKPLKC